DAGDNGSQRLDAAPPAADTRPRLSPQQLGGGFHEARRRFSTDQRLSQKPGALATLPRHRLASPTGFIFTLNHALSPVSTTTDAQRIVARTINLDRRSY